MTKDTQKKILTVLASVMLAITFFLAGFACDAGIPQTTDLLSSSTSEFGSSPYNHDSLLDLANETRRYTVEDYGRESTDDASFQEEYASFLISKAEVSSADSSNTRDRWSDEAIAILEDDSLSSSLDRMFALYEVGPQYALDANALEHLDDVNDFVSRLFTPILAFAVLAGFLIMCCVMMFGYKTAANALVYSGIATLVALILFVIFASISFESLFSILHSLFFEEGTWLFPSDSLLIEMYPIDFWMGMGVVWICTSALLSLISLVCGVVMKRKAASQKLQS